MNPNRDADHDICDTCVMYPATHIAHHTINGDTWQVCDRCKAQAIRYEAPIIHQPLIPQAEAS